MFAESLYISVAILVMKTNAYIRIYTVLQYSCKREHICLFLILFQTKKYVHWEFKIGRLLMKLGEKINNLQPLISLFQTIRKFMI